MPIAPKTFYQRYRTKPKKEDNRDSAVRRGYDARWRKARRWYLRRHPLCVLCGGEAGVVDHVVPHRGDMSLFWDIGNWQALCVRCHNRKTGAGQ